MEKIKTWNEMLIELGLKQTLLFSNDHIAYTDCLCTSDNLRKIMNEIYGSLILKNLIQRVEDWKEEEKLNLWNQTKEIANGRLSKSKLIELSKALICIEHFLN